MATASIYASNSSPYLHQFRTLEQLLVDERHPPISILTDCLSPDELLNICDVKGDDDLQAYRLNDEKTIAWLKLKVRIGHFQNKYQYSA